MKTCTCGGLLYRHDERGDAMRYRCKSCKKTITVRNGQISKQRGRPMVSDWRTQSTTEART